MSLEIRYVRLHEIEQWSRNPKRHDLGALVQSIRRYGFRDASIFDGKLGALVAGNGRVQALKLMHEQGEPPPKGIGVDDDGEWLVPVQYGADSKTVREAEAFGVDHNNLTLSGGDVGVDVLLSIWDEALLKDVLLESEVPVTLDEEDISALMEPFKEQEKTGGGEDGFWLTVGAKDSESLDELKQELLERGFKLRE